jgi:uncharacterized protein YbjT (DUF2867 family)
MAMASSGHGLGTLGHSGLDLWAPMVAPWLLATAAVIATAPKKHAGRTYRLTGPSLITYADIAEELSAALGHPVEYRQTSPAEHRTAMIAAGIPEAVATSNAQAFGLIAEGDAA